MAGASTRGLRLAPSGWPSLAAHCQAFAILSIPLFSVMISLRASSCAFYFPTFFSFEAPPEHPWTVPRHFHHHPAWAFIGVQNMILESASLSPVGPQRRVRAGSGRAMCPSAAISLCRPRLRALSQPKITFRTVWRLNILLPRHCSSTQVLSQ
jgi:hypothetical protein